MPSTDSALKKMSEMPDSEINPNGWKNTLLRKEYHEGVVGQVFLLGQPLLRTPIDLSEVSLSGIRR